MDNLDEKKNSAKAKENLGKSPIKSSLVKEAEIIGRGLKEAGFHYVPDLKKNTDKKGAKHGR